MTRIAPIVVGVILIIGLTVFQGIKADRWNESGADAAVFAAQLVNIPLAFGDWEGVDTDPGDRRELQVAGAVGHLTRKYRNTRTNEEIDLYIICGHSRDITMHTPDRCYPKAGFSQEKTRSEPFTVELDEGSAEFYTNTFRKEDLQGIRNLRIFWSWAVDAETGWQAPDLPRRAFAAKRAIYKMYLINFLPSQSGTADNSPCVEFGRRFLPTLNEALFTGLEQDGSESDATVGPITAPREGS